MTAEIVAVQARHHTTTRTGDTSGDEGHDGPGDRGDARVVHLPQRRHTDPAAVLAGLPPDTRPAPSVAVYDQLLPQSRHDTLGSDAAGPDEKARIS